MYGLQFLTAAYQGITKFSLFYAGNHSHTRCSKIKSEILFWAIGFGFLLKNIQKRLGRTVPLRLKDV